MTQTLTVPGPLVSFCAEKALAPGMHALVLRLGHAIDQAGIKQDLRDARWFDLPAADLRGGRDDNQQLRQWLRGLMGVELAGEYSGAAWGAVLIAEWHIKAGGSVVRVLVPPAAVNALRAPATFAKVEEHCMLKLRGAARQLYLALADKKRLDQHHWEFGLVELRAILGVGDKKAYRVWDKLRERVLEPAVSRINDFGTVHVTMTPIRHGRPIGAVRFDWRWKTLDEAREASEEAERHSSARRQARDAAREAPPLTKAPVEDATEVPERPSFEERLAILRRTGAAWFGRGGR